MPDAEGENNSVPLIRHSAFDIRHLQTTRLAPSPTGALHLGNARTFLVNWLLARQKGWKIILRIEDLDGPRIKRGADQQAIEDLRWLGIDWDEGPIYQSSRTGHYRAAIDSLLSRGLAYPCICTRKEAALAASAPHAEDGASVYPGTCRGRFASLDEARAAAGGREPAIRFAVSSDPIEFDDGFRGRVFEDPAAQLGDFVIAKADGTPAYQLAVVVDDADMQINQIVRGDDLLDSTPRQILLYHALNLSDKIPQYTHLPLVVGPDGRRLAKRHGDTRLSHYRELGVPAEKIVALLARWCALIPSPGEPGGLTPFERPVDLQNSSAIPRPNPSAPYPGERMGEGPERKLRREAPNPAFPPSTGERSRLPCAQHVSEQVPGEAVMESRLRGLLSAFNLKRIPPTPIIMSPDDEPRA